MNSLLNRLAAVIKNVLFADIVACSSRQGLLSPQTPLSPSLAIKAPILAKDAVSARFQFWILNTKTSLSGNGTSTFAASDAAM